MNQTETPDSSKEQVISNSDITNNFVKNIKDKIERIFYNNDSAGNGTMGKGDFIRTITFYLRGSKATSQKTENAQQINTQESTFVMLSQPEHEFL